MPEYITRSTPFFLSRSDEHRFDAELAKAIPGIRFVESSFWDSKVPPTSSKLTSCDSAVIFLWDENACPNLPYRILDSGQVRGPTSGVVIQLMRSLEKDGALLSGDIGIGYDKHDQAISAFVKTTWKVLRSLNAGKLQSFDSETGITMQSGISDYVVGAGAIELSKSGVTLKHCSANVLYRPDSAA